VLWRHTYPAPYKPRGFARKHGKGPFATPTIAEGKVYTFGIRGTLSCLDLGTGKLLWRKAFADQFQPPHPTWGAANSPLIEGDLCVLAVGSTEKGYLAAFQKDTGQQVWSLEAVSPGYGSPVAADLAGRRQIVTLTSTQIIGATADSGKLLWQIPFKTSYEQNATTPVVRGDRVIFAGYKLGTHAYRIRDGDAVKAERLWSNDSAAMYMTSPVVLGGHVYGLAQRGGGTLVCLSLENGQTAWAAPGRLGEYVSIVAAADRLLVLTTDGTLIVAAADPSDYKQLARQRLTDRPVWSHLALLPGRLYVKDKTHLACFDVPSR
jgi:outer membrane protein assembly factor BamB